VTKYEFKSGDLVRVTFDDEIVTIDDIAKALNKGGYPIKGKPRYLE
jgi:copper chaperone CopZ